MSEDPSSPYAPPTSELRSLEPDADRALATTRQRLATYVIDSAVLFALQVAVSLVLIQIRLVENPGLFFLATYSGYFLYYVVLESLFGWTVGKRIAGVRVLRDGGGPPSYGQVWVRTLVRFIPFEALSALGGKGFPRPWHDTLSRTRVIQFR